MPENKMEFDLLNPPILTLRQYIESSRTYEADIKVQANSTDDRAVAISSGSVALMKDLPNERLFTLDWVKGFAPKLITELQIKAEYMRQLDTMEIKMRAEFTGNSKLRSELHDIRVNAQQEPLHVSLPDLQLAVNQKIVQSLSCGTIFDDIKNKNTAKFGLQNEVAIHLQHPGATGVFKMQDLAPLGIDPKENQKAIIIFMPKITSSFIRDGKRLPISLATEQEQRDIVNKKLPVQQDVKFRLKWAYDISQLDITPEVRQGLIAEVAPTYTSETFKQFAAMIKTPDARGIPITETPMNGLSIDSLYNKNDKSIVINSELHEARKMSEYIKRISDVVTDLTSQSQPMVQNFEAQMLSFQLHDACKLPISVSDREKLADTFNIMKSALQFEGTGSFTILENTLARVNRSAEYVKGGLGYIDKTRQQQNVQEQSLQQAQMAKPVTTEELKNFIDQIQ